MLEINGRCFIKDLSDIILMIAMFQSGISAGYGMHNGSRRTKVSTRTRFQAMAPPPKKDGDANQKLVAPKKQPVNPKKRKQRPEAAAPVASKAAQPVAKKATKMKRYPG